MSSSTELSNPCAWQVRSNSMSVKVSHRLRSYAPSLRQNCDFSVTFSAVEVGEDEWRAKHSTPAPLTPPTTETSHLALSQR